MQAMVEPLEGRTLLSAVPAQAATVAADRAALLAAVKTAALHQTTCARMASGDLKAIKFNLKRLKSNPQNAALLTTVTNDYKSCTGKLKADLKALVKSGSKDVKRAYSDLIKVLRKPTDAAAGARLAADLASLQGAATSALATTIITDATDCQTTLTADFAAVTAANPEDLQLNQDVTLARDDVTDCMGMAQNDADALLAAAQKVATDAAAAVA